MTAKRRSEATPTGYAARHVGLNIANAGIYLSEQSHLITQNILSGNKDKTNAIRAASEIARMATILSDTGWNQADGNYAEAEHASKRLTGETR